MAAVTNIVCAVARYGPVIAALWLAAVPGTAQQFEPVPAPAAGRNALPARAIAGGALLAELRKGGYVIYFRHTSTDFSRDDARSRSDDDCQNQRPLTDKGRDEARQIGAAFRELKIPVGRVLASPRCRTMETATLAFGPPEKSSEARAGPAADSADRYAPLRTLLSTPVKPGANLVIASHGNPFHAVAGAPYLAEGEAAVIRPLGKDFELVARVKHDAWRALMKRDQ
jgi:phosphohistidine phosphatase SixA